MAISSGNLDQLVNVTFAGSDTSALSVQSYTTTGSGSAEAIATLTAVTTSSTSRTLDYYPGGDFTVIAVNDAANSIALQYSYDGQTGGVYSEYVLGFAPDGLLVDVNTSNTDAENLDFFGTSNNPYVNLVELSPSLVPTGTTVSFSIDSAATGIACFVRGTGITTTQGRVVVEQLRVGDVIPSCLSERFSRIRWIGHRTIDLARHPRPAAVAPVRIASHAFGFGKPARDLWLSPDHAVFIDAVLIPIRLLINHHTICQIAIDQVEYWHVELESHDVLLAEGLPAESYLDTGNRAVFANDGATVLLHPDFQLHPDHGHFTWEALECAPLVVSGAALEEVRRWLSRHAGSSDCHAASRQYAVR